MILVHAIYKRVFSIWVSFRAIFFNVYVIDIFVIISYQYSQFYKCQNEVILENKVICIINKYYEGTLIVVYIMMFESLPTVNFAS